MPVVTIIIKTFAAFSDGEVVIVSPGCLYIKKIGPAFAGTNSLAVNALHFLFIVVVRHSYKFYS